MRRTCFAVLVGCCLLAAAAGCGFLPIGPADNAPQTPYDRSYDLYLAYNAALVTANSQALAWKRAGLLSVETQRNIDLAGFEAQALMGAWKRLLVTAEAQGGVLPANHPQVVMEALGAIGRLTVLLAELNAGGALRAPPGSQPAAP